MNYEAKLNDVIVGQIEEMDRLEVGTEQYKIAVDSVCKLIDRSVDIRKIRVSKIEKDDERIIKMDQLESDKKERKIQMFINIGGIIIPVIVTVWGTLKSFEFEREGTVTTILGRKFVGNLLKK
nr:MAG TPA: hypothetical protein [Caudoviricetes sp.]